MSVGIRNAPRTNRAHQVASSTPGQPIYVAPSRWSRSATSTAAPPVPRPSSNGPVADDVVAPIPPGTYAPVPCWGTVVKDGPGAVAVRASALIDGLGRPAGHLPLLAIRLAEVDDAPEDQDPRQGSGISDDDPGAR
jgi:hypothetical protein